MKSNINLSELRKRTYEMRIIFSTGEICQYGRKKIYEKNGEKWIKFILFPDTQLWRYPEFYKKSVIIKKYSMKYTRILKEDIDHARILILTTPEGDPRFTYEELTERYKTQINNLQKTVDVFTERNSTMKKILDGEIRKLIFSTSHVVNVVRESGKAKGKIRILSPEEKRDKEMKEAEGISSPEE